MFNNKKSGVVTATGVGLALSAGASFAQSTGVDVSSVTSVLTEAATAAGTIGLAYLAMVAGVKLYKWIKSSM